MTRSDRRYLQDVYFVVAIFVAYQSLKLLYGSTRPEAEIEYPILGDLPFSEQIVFGIPLVWLGYAISFGLAFVLLREAVVPQQKALPSTRLSRKFAVISFYVLMIVPVLTQIKLLDRLHHRVTFYCEQPIQGQTLTELRGNNLYKLEPGPWKCRGEQKDDQEGVTVFPFFTPIAYDLLVLSSLISFGVLFFVKPRLRK